MNVHYPDIHTINNFIEKFSNKKKTKKHNE